MSPLAWQSNKALHFYFTQNSVSKIRFGTGAEAELSASVLASYETPTKVTGTPEFVAKLDRSTVAWGPPLAAGV